ncbi:MULTISPECIES: hypothetical protein [Staphylococcus]|nr:MULTISPECIES: hypothetical protein [Staphylococcus]EKS24056.1 hypothetical protein HMPREF9310_01883 [Staphylococcus simulans ACS-120-V-Sch1]MDK8174608.1 hypothetical protein [Staphylococcus simulans]OFO50713.1 hypothetical protein HMPREF3031_01680 [Staphylococcus sp. HMSC072B07]OFP26656.1 hypothetical protein HMPREF2997_06190 [Staphylococcus sp. HMSC057C08]OHR08302.1 hypothetical protein HMPREF2721_04820 [Staphylococcus sp. HMSC078A12]
MYKKILLFLLLPLFLVACNSAHSKVEGKWKYLYDKYTPLYLIVEDDQMFVEAEGVQVEVYELKKSTDNELYFVYEGEDDNNSIFIVHADSDNSISVEPISENQMSLARAVVTPQKLSKKAKNESTITMKKVE